MMYFVTSLHAFWSQYLLFNVMTYILKWRSIGQHDLIVDAMLYFLLSWRTFHTYWRYYVLFDVLFLTFYAIKYLLTFSRHDILSIFLTPRRYFKFMAYFLTLRLTFDNKTNSNMAIYHCPIYLPSHKKWYTSQINLPQNK